MYMLHATDVDLYFILQKQELLFIKAKQFLLDPRPEAFKGFWFFKFSKRTNELIENENISYLSRMFDYLISLQM